MTYALREGFRPSTTVRSVTSSLLTESSIPPTSTVAQSCC